MPSLTIKNLPAAVHRRLRARAALHGRSLNGEAIACLQAALGAEAVDADALLARARALRRSVAGRLTDRDVAAVKAEGRP
jgi:plasmid stability protein